MIRQNTWRWTNWIDTTLDNPGTSGTYAISSGTEVLAECPHRVSTRSHREGLAGRSQQDLPAIQVDPTTLEAKHLNAGASHHASRGPAHQAAEKGKRSPLVSLHSAGEVARGGEHGRRVVELGGERAAKGERAAREDNCSARGPAVSAHASWRRGDAHAIGL